MQVNRMSKNSIKNLAIIWNTLYTCALFTQISEQTQIKYLMKSSSDSTNYYYIVLTDFSVLLALLKNGCL